MVKLHARSNEISKFLLQLDGSRHEITCTPLASGYRLDQNEKAKDYLSRKLPWPFITCRALPFLSCEAPTTLLATPLITCYDEGLQLIDSRTTLVATLVTLHLPSPRG